MRRLRDTDTTSDAYLDWQRERQAEIEAEQKQITDAQEAAIEADPVLSFQKASNAEALAVREIILTGYIPDSLLAVERLNGRAISNEANAVANFKFFSDHAESFQHWMASQFLDVAFRSQIIPTAPAYSALHNLMLQYSAYTEPVQEEAAPASTETIDTRTPTEIAEAKYKNRLTRIVVYDSQTNIGYTEFDLEHKVDSKTELRLRRLMEGKVGNNLHQEFMTIKDLQQKQELERAAKGEQY